MCNVYSSESQVLKHSIQHNPSTLYWLPVGSQLSKLWLHFVRFLNLCWCLQSILDNVSLLSTVLALPKFYTLSQKSVYQLGHSFDFDTPIPWNALSGNVNFWGSFQKKFDANILNSWICIFVSWDYWPSVFGKQGVSAMKCLNLNLHGKPPQTI